MILIKTERKAIRYLCEELFDAEEYIYEPHLRRSRYPPLLFLGGEAKLYSL